MIFRQNTLNKILKSTFTVFSALLIAPLFGCMANTSNQSSLGDASCTTAQVQSDVLNQVNHLRAAGAVCGGVPYPPVAPLRWSTKLQQAAALHSQDMASHNFFSHKSATNSSTMPDRLRAVGYNYQAAGENIGAGVSTVSQVIDMWVASPGHCVILMTANFAELGASCQSSRHSYYKTYWTLNAAALMPMR